MKRFARILVAALLGATSVACGKLHPEPAQQSAPATAKTSRVESNDMAIEADQKAIELEAQTGKHAIDQIASDAEDALRRARANVKQEEAEAAKKAAAAREAVRQSAEAAAEAAEDAKDKALNAPEALERAVERTSQRFRDLAPPEDEDTSR
jgi:colicin import membrane protein